MRSRVRPRTLGPSGAGLARGRRPPGWLRVLSACAWLGDGTRRTVLSSVRVRLILWYVAILALVLLLFSSAIYVTERQALLSQLDGHINARLRQLSVAYDARSPRLTAPLDAATVQGDEIALLLTPAGQILQIQAAGRLAAVKVPWDRAVQILATAARSGNPSTVEQGLQIAVPAGPPKGGLAPAITTRAALFRLTGVPLVAQHRVTALLVVGIRSDVPQQLAALARTLETIAPLILLLGAGGGYWLADRALRPMRAIARTAQQINATDLSRRLNLRGHDELAQLSATFDHMLDRLEAAFERQHQFTADASHELRTPLAIVDLEATYALAQPRTIAQYRAALTIVQQEAGAMTRLVDDFLTLARADNGEATPRHMEVDLAEVVLDVAERLVPLARQCAMTMTIDPLPELLVWGDPASLTRMVTNIVENALKYGAGSATQAQVGGGCRRRDDVAGVWLRVADNGPGIAAEHLPHLCERFYRVDHARTHAPREDRAHDDGTAGGQPGGSGLGLAIVQWIIQSQRGDLRIQSEPGLGTIVEVWLPGALAGKR